MMMKTAYYILCGLLTFLSIPGYSQKVPDQNLLKGIAFAEIQAHDSVIYYFTQAGRSLEDYPIAYVFYGRSLLEKGQNIIAINEFLKAEKIDAGLASFWVAKAYARENDVGKTMEYLGINYKSKYREQESKILLDPDFQKFENHEKWIEFLKSTGNHSTLEGLLSETDYQIRSGNYTAALEMVNEGLKRGLMKSTLYGKRADVFRAMNNFRMAANDLSIAIEGDKRDALLYTKRAEAYMKLERFKLAVPDYDQAIKLAPLSLHLFKERAMAHNKIGNYEQAIQDINYFLQYFPQDHDGWYKAGMIHFSNQKYLSSMPAFNKAIELNTSNADYYEARGETYMQTKTYRYAWRDFSMALDLNPLNPKVYLSKGIAAINLGNMTDACNCFEMAKRQGEYRAEEYISRYCGSRP